MWINYIAYALISIISVNCISTFTTVTFNNAIFKYPGQVDTFILAYNLYKNNNIVFFKKFSKAKSERDLGICEQYSVCNIVHHRFWFPNQVERLCKCPNREECPWKWSIDNHTMPLDNRSQLKVLIL